MTEQATGLCRMGRSTDSPCPHPATEPMFGGFAEAELCALHAALMPLSEESDVLGVCLVLVRAYLKDARRQRAVPLVEVLERAEADFTARLAHVGNVVKDLRAAEYTLMRD